MLDRRRRVRRWADVVQVLYKCFVFAVMYINVKSGRKNFFFVFSPQKKVLVNSWDKKMLPAEKKM